MRTTFDEMSTNPHEMFRTMNNHFDWNKYDEQLDHIALSNAERTRVRKALRYFRTLLGEDFLSEAARTGHPLLIVFFNAAPRARLHMAELAEKMSALESADESGIFLKQLRNPTQADATLSVLTVAYRFLSAGFSIAFEPGVYVTQPGGERRLKYPDLKISNSETSEEIFVEVSQLLPSADQSRSGETLTALHFAVDTVILHDPDSSDFPPSKHVHPRVKFHRGFNEQELKDVISQIEALADRVRRTCKFGEFKIEGMIEVGIAPWNDRESAVKWAAERNMRYPELVEAPLIETDEVVRACRKILKKKVWQIPDEGPGIVVLTTQRNLMLFTHDIRYVIAEIEGAITREPRLFCTLLTLEFDGFEAEGAVANAFGGHTVFRKARKDGRVERAVLIRNPACKAKVSQESIDKIRRAFVG